MAKILVVDDETTIRTPLTIILKMNGHETIEADNGFTALEMIKAHVPQLIISDVMMANMNGFVLREFLQNDPSTAKIPVILMSGLAQTAGAWESDPSVDYIAKPFTDGELMVLVNNKLQGKTV